MKEQKNVKKEGTGNGEPVIVDVDKLPKISRVTFDERTGTITLKIASEEEIAEAEKLKNQSKV